MSKNNKRKCCKNKRNVPAAGLKENNINFDYDKFTEAIIKAEKKITEEKIKKQKEEDEEFQRNWKKSINFKENQKELQQTIGIILGIINFKKENVDGEYVIYILFKLSSYFLLTIYQLIFYFFAFINPILKLVIPLIDNIIPKQIIDVLFKITFEYEFPYLTQIIITIIFLPIAKLIRIAKFEIEASTNKEVIMSIFNTIIAFTAIVLATIAVIKA